MLAPFLGAVLIVVLAVVLIRITNIELRELDRLGDREHATGRTLSEISNGLASNHAQIYDLLGTVSETTIEGVFYDESKPLLFRIHELNKRIETELIPALIGADETAAVEEFLGLLELYRINVANAMLMATVNPNVTRRVMSDATAQFNVLNASLLKLNRLIDDRLDAQIANQHATMQEQSSLFATLFLLAVIAMLIVGYTLASVLTKDLRDLAAKLENILNRYAPKKRESDKPMLVVDTLSYAIERVGENYAELERAQGELARSNERLRSSLELVADREIAFAKLNAELEGTVERQEELIQAQRIAEEARDIAVRTAEQANAAKSDFLSNMSHELRTPLNAIIGFADMIHTASFGPIASKYQEYAGDISASGSHLLNLVTDVLDISRVEAGKLEINWDVVNLQEIAESCRKMLRTRSNDKGVQIDINIPDGIPDLHSDRFRLRQILINLADNAIKFSERDSVVRIDAEVHKDGRLTVSVVDNGVGIAREDIPKVLEKFGQVRDGHQYAHTGMGIGLAITKLLVELLDGELDINSELGVGTTVLITFPEHRTVSPPDQHASQP